MRNKIFLLSIVSILFVYCGGGETEPTAPPEPVNTAPSIPVLNSPTNNKLCISNIVVFEWSASTDSEKNPITYQLQVATDNQFAQIVNTSEVSGTTQSVTLDKGKAYYWRVKATDSKNASSSYSTVYSFYTEGVALSNHLPFIPELISPVNNTVLNTTTATLKWSGSDVDTNDVLNYDVFFGTESNPVTKVVDNKTTTSFDVTIQPSKVYYWRVVFKDNKGGETTGQIWSFRTN